MKRGLDQTVRHKGFSPAGTNQHGLPRADTFGLLQAAKSRGTPATGLVPSWPQSPPSELSRPPAARRLPSGPGEASGPPWHTTLLPWVHS